MMDFFLDGGVVMWPMAAMAAGVLFLAARAAGRVRRGGVAAPVVRRDLDGILFWGVMSVLLGLLGTVMGLVVMSRAAAMAGGIEPGLLWGGVGLSLHSLIFGVSLFLLSAMLWFLLRGWAVES